jgi:acetyl-CoA carboxylase carboxyltransferase component
VEGAGGVEGAVRAGVVSVVAEDDTDAVAKAARLVAMLPRNNLSEAGAFEYEAPSAVWPASGYTGAGAVEALCDAGSAIELFAGFGGGLVTALCTVAGSVAGIVATNGPDTRMGRLCAARAARFVRLCDAYSIPVVTVLNTGGFMASSESDEAGMIRQAARLCATYGDATTAKVCILAGRTFGAVYTALAAADLTIALEGSVTAPAPPAAAVSVLYKAEIEAADKPIEAETAARAKRYEAEVAGAAALQEAGLANFVAHPANLRVQVATALDILSSKRAQRMPKKHGNMPL